ncbi:hypothetical protein GF314_10205 [bacterium]|nr:hypothetical protein [bacterium]
MSKSLYLIAGLVLLLAGCSGGDAGDADQTTAAPAAVTIAQYNASPADYVEKTVEISGTVDHVCKHGGKRMFIMGDDPSDRVKIESGQVPTFEATLEGSPVRVVAVGRVETIDAAYLDAWESEATVGEVAEACESGGNSTPDEATAEAAEAAEADHDHAEHAEHDSGDLARIAQLRQQLAESGEDHLAFYHLECVSFEEL